MGGPAGSSGESPSLIRTVIIRSINNAIKLDFLSYHRYGDDNGGTIPDVTNAVAFHANIMNVVDTTIVKATKFMGEVINDEFGPSCSRRTAPCWRDRPREVSHPRPPTFRRDTEGYF